MQRKLNDCKFKISTGKTYFGHVRWFILRCVTYIEPVILNDILLFIAL